jgi:hypothetical protein
MIVSPLSTPSTAILLDHDGRRPSPFALGIERHGGSDYALGYPLCHMQGFVVDVGTTFRVGFGVEGSGVEGGILGWNLGPITSRASRASRASYISRVP